MIFVQFTIGRNHELIGGFFAFQKIVTIATFCVDTKQETNEHLLTDSCQQGKTRLEEEFWIYV